MDVPCSRMRPRHLVCKMPHHPHYSLAEDSNCSPPARLDSGWRGGESVKCGVRRRPNGVTFQPSFSHLIPASLQAFAVKSLGLRIDSKHEIPVDPAHSASEPAAHDKSEGAE
jgi:hypothetical protein